MAYGRKKISVHNASSKMRGKSNSVEDTFAIYRGAISMRLKRQDLTRKPSMPKLPPLKEYEDEA